MKIILFCIIIPFALFAQPSPVTIVSPQDSASSLISPINFNWNKSPLALAYTIQIANDNLFNTLVVNQSTSDTTYSTSSLLSPFRYYWRVRAENVDGASAWTNAMFTTKLNVPSFLNPATGAVDINLKPTLTWGASVSSAKFRVQVSLQSDFSTIMKSIDTTTNSAILDSLSRATTYYWRVRAYIKGDTTAYSGANSFTTIPNIPIVPNLLFPTDVSTNNAVNVVLRWSKVQNATSYNLQISTSPIFSTFLKDSSLTDTVYRPKPYLNSNTQYFWRVNATNSGGTSNYSMTIRFTTGIDTNRANISFQNINFGTVNAGIEKDVEITISNLGKDDLIINNFSNQQKGWTKAQTFSDVRALVFSGTTLLAGTYSGVFRSINNGTSWIEANTGLTTIQTYVLVVSDTNLFAGTWGGGVFRSTNNGISWSAVNTGLTSNQINALAVSGTNLFAGTSGGIFRSTNNGTSWSALNTGLAANQIYALAFSGSNLFASTGYNVILSTNNGENWNYAGNGLTGSNILSFAVSQNGSNGMNVFVGTNNGVFLSTNNGTNWSVVSLDIPGVTAIGVSGKNIFVGTQNKYTGNPAGVFLSTDNGASWNTTNNGLTNDVAHVFAFSGTNIFVGTGGGVFHSNYIDYFSNISEPIISTGTVAKVPIHFQSIPIGNMNEKIIIVSNAPSSPDTITVTGFGATYGMTLNSKNVNIGTVKVGQKKDTVITITNTGNVDLVINNISSNNQLFTASPSILTITAGTSAKDTIRFAPTTTGNASGKIIITSNSPSSPDTISVTGYGGTYGLNLSVNNIALGNIKIGNKKDTTITVKNTGNISLVVSNVTVSSPVFALSQKQFTVDTGKTIIDTIKFTPSAVGTVTGKIVFISNASTSPDTITVTANGVLTDVKDIAEIPKEYALSQNYPNPFNPSTTIRYAVPFTSRIKLSIFNMLGQQVGQVINEMKDAGFYEHSFNASQLSSGIYFYRIEAISESNSKTFVQTKKMVLMR